MYSIDTNANSVPVGFHEDPQGTLTLDEAILALSDHIDNAKALRLHEILKQAQGLLAAGYTCTNGITMDASASAMQLLKSGYDLASANSDLSMTITDFNNVDHAGVLLTDVWTMLLELGGNFQTVRASKAVARKAIVNAVSVADVRAVVL